MRALAWILFALPNQSFEMLGRDNFFRLLASELVFVLRGGGLGGICLLQRVQSHIGVRRFSI